MKYAVVSCVALVVCLIAGWFLTGILAARRGRQGHTALRVALSLVLGCVLMAFGMGAWLSLFYHADDEAIAALAGSATVSVAHEQDGYLFDGPGTGTVIVFFPGAKVQAEAYAPLMLSLAQGGADCLLVDPPAHIAPLGMSKASRLLAGHPYGTVWLAGHSLGGTTAALYATNHTDEVSGLVLLASYPSSDLPDSLSLCSMRGTEDGVLDSAAYEDARAYWPPHAQEVVLTGGNHANFGCYGAQKGDGEATMPAQEQQRQTTIAMLSACGLSEGAS